MTETLESITQCIAGFGSRRFYAAQMPIFWVV
jgi:hypothetical protein